MMSGPASECDVGTVLAGKYRVERVLGRGGMGVVVAARHIQLQELVAIKLLLPSALDNAEARGRFLREARAAARIRSEHVARVMDVGQFDDGSPYMVMEYLAGRDLSAALMVFGRFAVENAVDYVAQACEAIAEAHAMGIIHRDLKPANLMLVTRSDGSECVKVLDFGISKNTSAEQEGELSMTSTNVIFGSPLYMSPEQMASARSVDGRTDIWALGTILHELLAGTTPFQADNLAGLAMRVALEHPTPLHTLRADVPEGLSQVVLRCLEKNRAARFADIRELALALLPFAPERAALNLRRAAAILRDPQSSATAPVAQSAPVAAQSAANIAEPSLTGRGWARTTARKRPHGLAITAVALGLVLSTAVGVWLKVRGAAPIQAVTGEPSASVAALQSAAPVEPATLAASALPHPSATATAHAADSAERPASSAAVAEQPVHMRAPAGSESARAVAPKNVARPEVARPTSKRNVYDDL